MTRLVCFLLFAAAGGVRLAAGDEIVFRSDVSLVRVDAQVVGRDNRAITGLQADDFLLRDEGRLQEIRNFAREDMPVDVLFLLDVSGSMRSHVQRIASAAHQAFQVLGKDDRIGIMVFDRASRLRLSFRSNRADVENEFDRLLRQETFNGGTDITRALLDAAEYVGREARREARRAIVILTDDQTEYQRDEARVSSALVRADAVLSALIAPDAMANRGMGRGGTYPGGGYPGGGRGGGGGLGGPLGGIIFGRRGGGNGPYGGRTPGGGMGPHTHSAGTSEIARESGGDSMPVDDASALETTLSRLRQRYALHFHVPQDARPGQQRTLDVQLTDAARRRYPDAEVRFRRVYLAPTDVVYAGAQPSEPAPAPAAQTSSIKRRPGINEPDGPRGPNSSVGGGWPAATESKTGASPASTPAPQSPSGGWRRVKPGEQ